MTRFSGKVVIVTGSGSGIGAATARRFAQDGASVVLNGRTREKLERVTADLEPDRVLVQTGDVSDQGDAEALIAAAVERFGRLDILVNNAGVVPTGPLLEASVADWRKVMAIDVDGVFFCTRAALPHLIRSGGNIVNVSSVSGLGGDWNMSFYNAAKGAVSNFTRSLALELGERGVRVNAVNPGLTFTDLTEDMKGDVGLMKRFAERIPLGRGAEPDEVADVIAFLASEDARYVTGVNLPVDGGLTASNGQPKQA
ncbi:SDR family NAD(P)-dependent oxidoreductase [Methylorubrum extorquens]|uniref:SDR family NAD(P)-dependent oxidoreductase n=1 Tax=Methylorubrum extorquens TaxID=408 RepID=UPI000158FE9F|nr:SDR family oxidoreductase [Methylorubrum extorquens]KQO98073.1 3-oxoacyl-ACP reductase [Methylobacterium sp. Leaf92]KQP88673.1 3-oxoacyl-ACP reductase [Methylobacterium sp. Leaf119]ABY29727.1 short-chain dehydrogenase/reductase SDR [Methylorubrum extorquens PA1]UYW27579.1 SDR family oxidoreductase [Methylorubrum extorquens]WIU41047.1 SDR family oxidoreductase [Methylorubrum extorquens]